jgi:hypothetical protein
VYGLLHRDTINLTEELAMPGPWKSYDLGQVGTTSQYLYNFVQLLFGPGNAAVRSTLLGALNEAQLRTLLQSYGISIPSNIGGTGSPPLRIMLVDIESAQTWQDPTQPKINPTTDFFYVLVMPPVPTRFDPAVQPGYEEMQAWESAWYHAVVDGYGM